ncbi:hypothetical protein HMPREF0476_0289 [Kingella kingae ATCC 23330]|uniref:Uncharacterized protein n=1 Tax=Kingella kingae ATCC 23330 TaxID=887327 RepID=F5S506_KINKI|nr:hypothetical protein HMPREF0476_0289 [Kingella kingae ATCC 23330]
MIEAFGQTAANGGFVLGWANQRIGDVFQRNRVQAALVDVSQEKAAVQFFCQ